VSHPLVWLWWRDSVNALRSLIERVSKPRGALAVAGLVLFCTAVAFTTHRSPGFAGSVSVYGAPSLMVLVALGAFSPLGLYFRPADVDWLLTAPLSRTALVVYNVMLRARTALLSGLLLSLLPNWRGAGWWQAFTGYTLVFLLLQTSAQWLAVVRAWLTLHLPPVGRRVLGISFIGLPLLAVLCELNVRSDLGFREFFLESVALEVIGAPARPFLLTSAAPTAIEWFGHASLSVAILAAAIAHMCLLDVPYREAAIRHSERRAQRFARMRTSGGAFSAVTSHSTRRVPMFPYLAGAGPVAWRQIQELVRNPRGILLLLSIVALVTAAAIVIPLIRPDVPDLMMRMGRTGIFFVTFLPLLMGDNLACDFRRDLDRMGQLKTWPISPLALAAGQIAPAAAFATAVQVTGVIVLSAITSAITPGVTLLVLALMPIVSWVALCIDNLLFLWLPYRTVPEDPGDVAFVGRTFATALFKFTVLTGILGLTLATGTVALELTGSRAIAVVVPVVSLFSACAVGTLAVANAFRRYDVARHAPV
jgi:Putative ABC exporter